MMGSAARPSGRIPQLLAACVFALILGLPPMVFTHVFSGRGAFIHIGVFVGTHDGGQCLHGHHPKPAQDHRGPHPRRDARSAPSGAIGKQRSLHNTYLTLPVLLMMISNHFAMLTNASKAWLLAGPHLRGRRGAAALPGAP